MPIVEAGLAELVRAGLDTGRLSFVVGAAAAVGDCEFAYLCVPTPQGEDGSADLSYIRSAAAEIGPLLPTEAIVVNKSTVPVGSTRVVEEVLGRDDVRVVSNPEFLREGSAVHDFLNPDRVVIGADDQAAAFRVAGLFELAAAPAARHRPGLGGDDQVRVQRLPGGQGVVRQRHRQRVRGGRRRRPRRPDGHELRQAHRLRVHEARPRIRWKLLPG